MIPLAELLRFIAEDSPRGDLTTDTLAPLGRCRARIFLREPGVAAGVEEAATLFSHFGVKVLRAVPDGMRVEADAPLMNLEGDAAPVLLVERSALNLIARMSGIATMTRALVETARRVNPSVRVAATRKTAPGLRLLDKKAVVLGGGDPHRATLSDRILIKDNHLALIPLTEAIQRARARMAGTAIEVEVTTLTDALTAAEQGADMIMLDNMDPWTIRTVLATLRERGLRERVGIEISGGITPENIAGYAALGADVISIGRLTHSVRSLDVSLEVSPAPE
ncbi:MAG: carboxylating nicotinate-nucleotide diphosphorylase [Methanomicrobiales archaeon]|nr:carboxylating nicotinate-nucleotide diphosphorylase [Methanomicrobiales archaeon]MDD1659898.1 carboxylating nicotinate-nucleotide diphosphorylase [Methanomicrobiales archaeon]